MKSWLITKNLRINFQKMIYSGPYRVLWIAGALTSRAHRPPILSNSGWTWTTHSRKASAPCTPSPTCKSLFPTFITTWELSKTTTTIRFESPEPFTISCSTKVCSFGNQVVEKVETEHPRYESNGRCVYRIENSPMCEYMITFINKLKQLPEKNLKNSVLENFSVLQVNLNDAKTLRLDL